MLDDPIPERPIAVGGRRAALAALTRIRPSAYARSRNFLSGTVTRLSPYVRHGIVTLAEVRDAAFRRAPGTPLEKFVQELAWREYYVRVREAVGDAIWHDFEPYKTGRSSDAYARDLPEDIEAGQTGLACMDDFVRELRETGYLHNHARMWFASYVVHTRNVAWQAGARFFLRLLVDGDPASNNLSWQWVASTFSHKPYIFNRANLERYTNDAYCAKCPLRDRGCPFEGSYERLDDALFPNGARAIDTFDRLRLRAPADVTPTLEPAPANAIVWQHEESLSPRDPARAYAPAAPAIFVWDDEARRRDPWSPLRERFVEASLDELSLAATARGDAVAEIARFARDRGARTIASTRPVDPRLLEIGQVLGEEFDVVLLPAPRLGPLDRETDLTRFSRYWTRAKTHAFGAPIG